MYLIIRESLADDALVTGQNRLYLTYNQTLAYRSSLVQAKILIGVEQSVSSKHAYLSVTYLEDFAITFRKPGGLSHIPLYLGTFRNLILHSASLLFLLTHGPFHGIPLSPSGIALPSPSLSPFFAASPFPYSRSTNLGNLLAPIHSE
jgi:hypothetical protein